MNEVIYSTKEECVKAIATLKAIGIEPLPWMLSQLKAFEDAEIVKNTDTPIWDTLRANYPYGVMPQEKIYCVESTVSQLLEEGEHAEEPGLLLGKIQCGKTDTFEDIIGLAFDRGVDIAIVITKGTKALVNQTIMRMKHDYQYFKASDSLEQRATINIYDIMGIGRNGLKVANVEGCKTVIVCKKQAQNLNRLMELFETKSPFLKNKKVLIVDDEADFASRNYHSVQLEAKQDKDGNPIAQTSEIAMAKISKQIDDFRKIPDFCRYLQVTATPYCLYLQPQGELNLNGNVVKPFKPRFTSLVPTHSKYVGGQQYFVESQDPDSMFSHLYHQVDQKCVDVLGHEDKRYLTGSVSSGNIYGLTYTLVAYFMAAAVRRIQVRETEHKDYKTSAIIHVDIDKKNHDWQRRIVTRLIDSIKSAIVDEDQSDLRVWNAINSVYADFEESNRKGREGGLITVALPGMEDILDEIRDIFSPKVENFHVQMVNSDEDMTSLLDEETGELRLDTAATIFIGGNILDRGVTIKNMLCFFYGRDPKNFQQDTVLQHARMYGARSMEDMAVMRLHTTPFIYKIMSRMNELDEQLRQWFIEGKDKQEPNAVFIGYDKNINPCATSKIKASNALLIRPQKNIVPVGFWTLGKTAIRKTMEEIDRLIVESPNYQKQDADGFFEMDKERVVTILKLIESTFVYDEKFNNTDRKNDIKEMLCAVEYCSDAADDKFWVLHRLNRNMGRMRENGGFIDAPYDGRTDLKPSRKKAIDRPVIMFLRQNGAIDRDVNTGDNKGWNGANFYWPALLPQQNLTPVMFALDQRAKGQKAVIEDDFLKGINPADVLALTFKGDLEEMFGKEGEQSQHNECRLLKETTASKYIQKNADGSWMINPAVPFDSEHYHGVYSVNKDHFPFVFRPYKYLCLRNRRDAMADMMLIELNDPSTWETRIAWGLDENGDLCDATEGNKKPQILLHGSDTIIAKDMTEEVFRDETIGLWAIFFNTGKILKFKKCTIDWSAIFVEEAE